MIEIGKLRISSKGDRARLSADIVVDGVSRELWFEVEQKYGEYLCTERSDAFVVGILPLAFKTRQDISFVTAITDQLKDQLEHDFIDVVCQHQPTLYHVKLTGKTASPHYKTIEMVGTGVSCGVDSLFTIKRRLVEFDGKKFLLLNNMTDPDESLAVRFDCLRRNAHSFAADAGIELIVSDSNYCGGIPGLCAEGCTTYCNLFSVLSLQKLFSRYFIASGGPIRDFNFYLQKGMFGTDCSDYDLLTLSACSTSSCRFIVDGLEERIKKVQALIDWPLAWNHLDVCFRHADGKDGNGTYDCPKCMHTIVEILVAGGMSALEKFAPVFDVKYVKAHMEEYLADLIRIRMQNTEYGNELWPLRKRAGFSSADYLKAMVIVIRKALRKVLRFGRVNKNFLPRG